MTQKRLVIAASKKKPGNLEVLVTHGPQYMLLELSMQEVTDFVQAVPHAMLEALELQSKALGKPLDLSKGGNVVPLKGRACR
jgi:hypothetical protein